MASRVKCHVATVGAVATRDKVCFLVPTDTCLQPIPCASQL